MTLIIGYVDGVPIYSTTTTSTAETQTISGSTLTAAQIIQLLHEVATKQASGATNESL